MLKYKIVTDSSSDMLNFNNIPFAVTPLKIMTEQKEYVDNNTLDVAAMVD